ncbi:MAG TPA: hypothetical protein PK251_06015 [Candidatus Latescibacteria bacterium]|nr:hypothetical protein [Candidatus Latescibacterota bacterium]HOS64298.1 hypothetical protein [Candidatus Latescibacterota bacterium]HPK74377.1 hypothetical protein [Candidatus Latescibacterota bacterium]
MVRSLLVTTLGLTGLVAATFPYQGISPALSGKVAAETEFQSGIVLAEPVGDERHLPDLFVVASRENDGQFALTNAGKGADLPDLVVFGTRARSEDQPSS